MKKVTTILAAFLFTAGMAFAQNNSATVDQTGDGNDATVTQENSGSNIAEVSQEGDDNQIDLTQRNFGSAGSPGHEADLSQDGDNNEADVLSQGGVGVNTVTLDQIGDYNYARIDQFWGSNNADVKQDGEENEALVSHRGTFDSDASIEQIGNYNDAYIRDAGQGTGPNENNSASIFQDGDDNTSVIDQFESNNRASSWIAGDGNTVTQTQFSDGNTQRVEITGSDNTYTVTQEVGTGNQLYVNSRGTGPGGNTSQSNNSSFTATQSGAFNLISGSMGGDGNSLTITQTGDDNSVSGGLGLWDAAGFTIDGDSNMASISQMSDGNSAVLSIVGNGNTATISQN